MIVQSASDYVDNLQRQGRYGFNRGDLENTLSASSSAVTKALNRLARKNRVRKVRKGFHIVIPVEFSAKGTIPPDWFIDDLMRYLGCSFYIGLQSAAAYYGAAHQQIQEFQVVTPKQILPVELPELNLRFFRKIDLDSTKIRMIKGHGSMLPVSTPEATAIDLVRYANRIGGPDSVITILQELVESMDPKGVKDAAASEKERASLQRLGWFFDRINATKLADVLHSTITATEPLPRAKLDPSGPWRSSSNKNRWQIVENAQPESDL